MPSASDLQEWVATLARTGAVLTVDRHVPTEVPLGPSPVAYAALGGGRLIFAWADDDPREHALAVRWVRRDDEGRVRCGTEDGAVVTIEPVWDQRDRDRLEYWAQVYREEETPLRVPEGGAAYRGMPTEDGVDADL